MCNVYVAQVVLKHFSVEDLKKMTHEERMEKLFPLVRERLLVCPPSRNLSAGEISEFDGRRGRGGKYWGKRTRMRAEVELIGGKGAIGIYCVDV